MITREEIRQHCRRAAGMWFFGCAAYDAATHILHLLPDNIILRGAVAVAFLAFLDEETAKALVRDDEPVVVLVHVEKK